jgi:hypothetical protein
MRYSESVCILPDSRGHSSLQCWTEPKRMLFSSKKSVRRFHPVEITWSSRRPIQMPKVSYELILFLSPYSLNPYSLTT